MPVKKPTTRAKRAAPAAKPEDESALFQELEEQAEPSFEQVVERVKEEEALPPARRAARERRESEALDVAATATPEAVIRAVADLRVGLNASLDGVSASLVEQAKKLSQLAEAAEVRRRQLAELADIQVAGDTLSQLIATHEQERLAFERGMAEAQAAWEVEKKRLAEMLAEEKSRTRKEWQREQEEYEYGTKIRRQREEEEYQARRAAESAARAEEKLRADQALAVREQAVAASEAELAQLRSQVQAFPAELERTVAQAREQARIEAEARAGHEAELRAKDAEATEKLQKVRITSLEQLTKDQAGRIEELQNELREATEKVQAIAVKVIEGASGAAALSRVSEIALQQAKGRTEG